MSDAPGIAYMFVDGDGDLLGYINPRDDLIPYRRADIARIPDDLVAQMDEAVAETYYADNPYLGVAWDAIKAALAAVGGKR